MSSINAHRPGYKQTLLGWIPQEWTVVSLNKVAEILGGYAFDSRNFKGKGTFQVIKMSNLYGGMLDLKRSASFVEVLSNQEAKFLLKKNDIIITLTGTVGKRDYGYSHLITYEKNLLLNQRIARVCATGEYNPIYLSYELKSNRTLNQFFYSARGGTGNQANVGTGDLELLNVMNPPIVEQNKIATILTTWDVALQKTQQLIEQLKQRNKGLMQQLLTGKKRLEGYDGKWKQLQVRNIASEVSLKNNADKSMTVLSCTKYDGLVDSLEYFGRRVFSEDTSTYKVVPRGYFAYATNHIEEGSIGYQSLHDEALISPMYTVFKTSDSVNDIYLYKVLKSQHYIHEYQKRMEGSIDRRGGLRWDEFSKIPLNLPPPEEQQAIVLVLDKANNELKLYEEQLANLQMQKKGLMQKLLSGEVRVNTSN